jgi:hypothetical protein
VSALKTWGPYGVLVALAAALGLAGHPSLRGTSTLPSVDNPAGPGVAALFTYLRESGSTTRAWREPLTSLPSETQVLVLTAPTVRPLRAEEVDAVDRFVRRGGTLVYLAPPSSAGAQPLLNEWARLGKGRPLQSDVAGSKEGLLDPLGVTVDVWRASSALEKTAHLRVQRGSGIELDVDDAVPVAGLGRDVVLWQRSLGHGELWVAAGPDLAQNRRLELDDNLAFWTHLAARGPVYFDEGHHHEEEAPAAGRGLAVLGFQWVAVVLMFAWVRGTRFGPPRWEPPSRDRSTLEYLRSFAWLTRRAHVERELVAELLQQLRVTLQEQAGIALELPAAEVDRELVSRCRVPAGWFDALVADYQKTLGKADVTPRDYARLSRRCAQIERVVRGEAEPPAPA